MKADAARATSTHCEADVKSSHEVKSSPWHLFGVAAARGSCCSCCDAGAQRRLCYPMSSKNRAVPCPAGSGTPLVDSMDQSRATSKETIIRRARANSG